MSRPANLKFLLSASKTCVEDFELMHLNLYSGIVKHMKVEFQQAAEELADAELARYLLENWKELHEKTTEQAEFDLAV